MRATFIVDLHVLLKRNDSVLFGLRAGTGYQDGRYSLIAGHLEQGETLIEGAIREVHEEVGLQLRQEDLRLLHVMHHRSNGDRLALFFLCDRWDGEPYNREPHKCAELKWHTREQVDSSTMLVPYIKAALKAIDESRSYSEFGDWHA